MSASISLLSIEIYQVQNKNRFQMTHFYCQSADKREYLVHIKREKLFPLKFMR